MFLRNELCSNNLNDFQLKKGWTIGKRCARSFWPSPTASPPRRRSGSTCTWTFRFSNAWRFRFRSARCVPGIKIHDTRMIRLMEVLLHGGIHLGGWTAKEIHQAVLTTFGLSEKGYRLNQLRLICAAQGPCAIGARRLPLRLPPHHQRRGGRAALLFFHKRLCGPLANSRFHHRSDPQYRPNSQLETAYHRADKAIQSVVDVLAAA